METSIFSSDLARMRRRMRKDILKSKRLKAPRTVQKIRTRRGLYLSKESKRFVDGQNLHPSPHASSSQISCSYEDQYPYVNEILNTQKFRSSEDEEYMDIGDMDIPCPDCGAMIWINEKSTNKRKNSVLEVSLCCKKGKVTIPYMKQPPSLLRNLFSGVHPKSSNFLANIRSYNNMFSFTSLGGKVDIGNNINGGPPNFVVSGQNYHRIGSLIPNDGNPPKFAQLYIYDTQNEVANRLSHFNFLDSKNSLDPTLVKEILDLMDESNILVKSFRMVRDYICTGESVPVSLRLFRNRRQDPRIYNVPELDEVAALVVGDIGDDQNGRDIVVRERDGYLQRLHETHSKYIPLQYPLLFPFGEDQYQEKIPLNRLTTSLSKKKRKHVTLRSFIAFRIQERVDEDSVILKSKRLFQQFIVDLYSMIESQILSFVRHNQGKIRSHFLAGIEEAVNRGDLAASSLGARIVLPSSFTGGRHYMFNNCQDAMGICKKFGYPDLFLTFTCNPKWPEIQRHMAKSNNASVYRPDILCRVFNIKLKQMMADFRKGKFFGRVIASLYTIEFQKRGLPHAHILLWLDHRDKLQSATAIDSVICAELPDKEQFPKLYSIVTNFMIHGPCGTGFPKSPCMKDHRCSKFYPKKFVSRTSFDPNGYPIYRRRDFGHTVTKKEAILDNRSVVPYNPKLIMKYQAHINIEYCNKSNCIKYLFKYITKGVDRVTATLQNSNDDCVDEIQQYYDCRFLSPSESMWRIFAYKIHVRYPPVFRLTFHTQGNQRVIFKDDSNLNSILKFHNDKGTMFLAWMDANKEYVEGRHLTYTQFPTLFTYDSNGAFWKIRKRGVSIGRLSYVPHGTRELYYMRLLLNVQVGCTCFEDIRTVDGHVYDTYREACSALRLLENDREFIDAIVEVSTLGSGFSIRRMFSNLLMSNSMSDPFNVWEQLWETLADGILYEKRRLLNSADYVMSSEDLKEACLFDIDNYLRQNGKSLEDFECMPKLKEPNVGVFNNILLENEFLYDYDEMKILHDEHFVGLNSEQLYAYEAIYGQICNGVGTMFFVDGYGGTGKTFLWKTLSYRLRSEGKIVVNVASSGIASILLPGGRTAHSQFSIPLDLTKESCCKIEKGSKKAELLIMASLIIWDEAPMINKWAFEAFDRSLQDVMSQIDILNKDLPFGGKTIVFGGDFRQILPVIPKGSRADIVHATINSSYLWRRCRVLRLTKNMRLQISSSLGEDDELVEFARWILDIGDGKIGEIEDGQSIIEIPEDILIQNSFNPIGDIVEAIYPNLLENIFTPTFFEDRAILAPTLDVVEVINNYVLGLIPGDSKQYLSSDSVTKCDDDVGVDHRWITVEFLNSIKCSGMPNHKLIIKVGVVVMLLRNIDVSSGLCNGTRLIVMHMGNNVIGAKIVSGTNVGDFVYIPRMNLIPSDANVSIGFQRRQFPLSVCFAMTINKSQGQTLACVGLYLSRSVFTHGQLYVAVSRVKSRSGLKILVLDDNGLTKTNTVNVVYPEVFQRIYI